MTKNQYIILTVLQLNTNKQTPKHRNDAQTPCTISKSQLIDYLFDICTIVVRYLYDDLSYKYRTTIVQITYI